MMKKLLFFLFTMLLASPLAGMEQQRSLLDVPDEVLRYDVFMFFISEKECPGSENIQCVDYNALQKFALTCRLFNAIVQDYLARNTPTLMIEIPQTYTQDWRTATGNLNKLLEKLRTLRHPLALVFYDPYAKLSLKFLRRLIMAVPLGAQGNNPLQLRKLIIHGNHHINMRFEEARRVEQEEGAPVPRLLPHLHPFQQTICLLNFQMLQNLHRLDILTIILPSRTGNEFSTSSARTYENNDEDRRTRRRCEHTPAATLGFDVLDVIFSYLQINEVCSARTVNREFAMVGQNHLERHRPRSLCRHLVRPVFDHYANAPNNYHMINDDAKHLIAKVQNRYLNLTRGERTVFMRFIGLLNENGLQQVVKRIFRRIIFDRSLEERSGYMLTDEKIITTTNILFYATTTTIK